MEERQELEWAEAQRMKISEDLVAAAKRQLRFLAEIEKIGCLYDGPVLARAVYRYKFCWLPLLAKHDKPGTIAAAGPLVVPLDCEWVWHCHRLNPVQYKRDCEKLYGRILDNKNVVSSVSGLSSDNTESIWRKMYPDEPYEIDLKTTFGGNTKLKIPEAVKATEYDLIAAVKRQSPFFYQVSRPHMSNDLFLEEAVSRYKGFLHLIKTNYKKSIKRFCVPTYDIDLIWHAHQLHPVSYCKDLMNIMSKVLEHDDTDSDRNKGQKLDVGFSATTEQWETTFGSRYWRAGAMYRCDNIPSLFDTNPTSLEIKDQSAVTNPQRKLIMEVMLEIMEVKGLPFEQNQKLAILFSKKEPDVLFNCKQRLKISSSFGDKSVAVFQCEPIGKLELQLISYSPPELAEAKPYKLSGTLSIPLKDLTKNSISWLAIEKWFQISPHYNDFSNQPINILIALSFTPPFPAPEMLCTFNAPEDASLKTKGGNKLNEAKVCPTTTEDCCNYGEGQDSMSSHCGGCGGCGGGCGGCGGGCGASCVGAKAFGDCGCEVEITA